MKKKQVRSLLKILDNIFESKFGSEIFAKEHIILLLLLGIKKYTFYSSKT